MIPSGGRGAAILRFLKEQEQAEASQTQSQTPPLVGRGRGFPIPQATSLPADEDEGAVGGSYRGQHVAKPMSEGRGVGRGMYPQQPPVGRGVGYYEKLPGTAAYRSPPEQVEPTPAPETEVSRPVGRGRAALLNAYFGQQQAGSSSPAAVPAPAPASSPRPGQGLQTKSSRGPAPPTEQFGKMQMKEVTEPLVNMGTSGRKQDVVCNYITLTVAPGRGVFEYVVSFQPEADSLSMRVRMLNQHLAALGGTKSFDGCRQLFLPICLQKQETILNCEHPVDGTPVKMTLSYKGQPKMTECTRLYNDLFRRIMGHLGLKNMGRKFFDPSGSVAVPQHKLEVWPGFVTSVAQFEGGLQLCCDASHRVMRTDSALEALADIARRHPQNYKDEALKLVLGAVVLTRYNNKMYRIDDIDWNQSPRSTFPNSEGKEVRFWDYYNQNYNVQIRDMEQPLLLSRPKKKRDMPGAPKEERLICLVPELCYITGLSDSMRADFRVMKDLTQKFQMQPQHRYQGLMKFLENIRNSQKAQDILKPWGLEVAPGPVKLTARVVNEEKLLYGDGSETLPPGKTNWNVTNMLLGPKELRSWLVIHQQQDAHIANDFVRMMNQACNQMGMKTNHGRIMKIPDNRIETMLSLIRQNCGPDVQMLVVFFPTLRSDRYAALKKFCCIEHPVPSQVIISRTLSRPDKARSIVKKIAMQINCKLGGCLWGLHIPFEKLMVCGLDVYHSPGKTAASVLGFVATSNPVQTQWYSRVKFGGGQQEIADSLRMCMLAALQKYKEVNNCYPERIMVFRDGVGDGQLLVTQNYEVPQILESFPSIHPNYKPKLTVVVCQKRIMTRMFAVQSGSDRNMRLQNPPPGTVLDHTVTRFNWYDFFLVSQCSNRGTVSPTHYVVVHDDGNTKPDHVQRLTYKMTHLYYNWTGTISVPAPTQYAHRLAQLVGEHLHKEPSPQLSDKLFFL